MGEGRIWKASNMLIPISLKQILKKGSPGFVLFMF